MKYSVDRMHEIKHSLERRSGKSVDAVADVIGKLMVTENEIIPLVVAYLDRERHLKNIFVSLCKEHFNVTPIFKRQFEWMIEGYSSKIKIISVHGKPIEHELLGLSVIPTYDLD